MGPAHTQKGGPVMRTLAPWTGIDLMRREMDRLFDRFFEPPWELFAGTGEWAPKVDVSETKEAVVVKAEIPGVEQRDISVTLEDKLVTIKGEKQKEKEEKDEKYHRVERSWGAFTRVLTLPTAVEGEKVTATFKEGVLTV